MNKYNLLCIALFASALNANAQVRTVNIGTSTGLFDSTYVFQSYTTDSVHSGNQPGTGPYMNGDIYVCKGATLKYGFGPGTSSMPTFYLDENARLIFYTNQYDIKIFAKAGASVDANNQDMLLHIKRESTASLVNINGNSTIYDSVFTTVNYTFSAWPGSANPCNIPAGINNQAPQKLSATVIADQLYFNTSLQTAQVVDMQGRSHKVLINAGEQSINIASLASGVYVLRGKDVEGNLFVAKFSL
jgi:hypothetical protein